MSDVLNQLYNVETNSNTARNKIPIEVSVGRQIERCNITRSNPDPSIFEKNVLALVSMLPKERRVETEEYYEENFIDKVEKWEYKYWCGVPLGTPNRPKKTKYGEIISPWKVVEEYLDYERTYNYTIGQFEDLGVTWRTETSTVELGLVDNKFKIPDDIVKETREAIDLIVADKESKGVYLTSYELLMACIPNKPPEIPFYPDDYNDKTVKEVENEEEALLEFIGKEEPEDNRDEVDLDFNDLFGDVK